MVRLKQLSVVGGALWDDAMTLIPDISHATTYAEVKVILEHLLSQTDKLQQLRNDGIISCDEFSLINQTFLSVGTYAINRFYRIQED